MDGSIKNLRNINISVQVLYSLAVIMEKIGSLTKALSIVKRAITNAPNNQKLYLHASRLYLKKGQVDKAAIYMKKAAGQENLGIFLYCLNGSYRKKMHTGHQSNTYWWSQQPEGKESYGNNTANSNKTGLDLLERDCIHAALTVFLQDLKEDEGDAGLYYNIGYTLSKLNRHIEALKFYEKAQSKGLNNVELLNNKGYSLFMLDRFEEAQTCYELARCLAPLDYTVLNNIAACYIKTNRPDKAVNYYKSAAQSNPGDATLENNLAMCLEANGQKDEAVRHYDLALQCETKEELKKMITLNKIKCFITLQRYQDALVLCDGLPDEKLDYELWSIRGELLGKLGKNSEAAESYRKAFGLTT